MVEKSLDAGEDDGAGREPGRLSFTAGGEAAAEAAEAKTGSPFDDSMMKERESGKVSKRKKENVSKWEKENVSKWEGGKRKCQNERKRTDNGGGGSGGGVAQPGYSSRSRVSERVRSVRLLIKQIKEREGKQVEKRQQPNREEREESWRRKRKSQAQTHEGW